jgi:flagellar biosynthesis protein FlhF
MAEALKMVKAELGADAMILSSRKERKKGILGIFSKPYFEVTAALDQRPATPRANPYREKEERELSTREEFQNSMLGPLARELRDLRDKVEKLSTRESAVVEPPTPAAAAETTAAPAQAAVVQGSVASRFSKEDLDDIKKYLMNVVTTREKRGVTPVSFPVENLAAADGEMTDPVAEYQSNLEQLVDELKTGGVADDAATVLIDYIRPSAERGEEMEELRYSMFEAFANTIKCTGPLRLRKDSPRIIALVGPTGVGKTTTTAKLAAHYAMHKGASVALITIDNFRVGAVEQLKTYSRIMDIPIDVANTPDELKSCVEIHRDKDLILIDTAGRSPKDQEKLEELKSFLDSAHGVEIHLCLSATTKDKELDDIVGRFSALSVTRVLFTKLDESETLGCIVNTHVRHKLPLSYFTNGQMVPEDIVVASPRRLANLILREKP